MLQSQEPDRYWIFLGADTVTNIWEITLRISVSTDTFYFLYTQNTYKDTFFCSDPSNVDETLLEAESFTVQQ